MENSILSSLPNCLRGPEQQFQVKGLQVLKPNHPLIQDLFEQGFRTTNFGSRIWCSSYLLIEYLSKLPLAKYQNIIEVGCGWGLPAIYLKKSTNARVTVADADSNVFPYQRLLSDINKVNVDCQHVTFQELANRDLSCFDMLVGADICYSYENANDLMKLFEIFLSQPHKEIILADNGRVSFLELRDKLDTQYEVKSTEISLQLPSTYNGHILHVRNS